MRLLQRETVEAEPATARKTVRYGSEGDDVLYLQSRLNRAPEVTTHLAVDRIFGPKTRAPCASSRPPIRRSRSTAWSARRRGRWSRRSRTSPRTTTATAIAKKLFFRGAAAYDARDYAHAYDFFTQAQESEYRPTLVFSRAQALRRLGGRSEEAIAPLRGVPRDAGPVAKG